MISYANFADGAERWENTIREVHEYGFRHVSIGTLRFVEPGSGAIAPSSSKAPELAHIAAAVAKAKSLGMTVTINPFVEVQNFAQWRGSYNPEAGSAEANRFWSDYQDYLSEVAELAEAQGADFMTIGTELRDITRDSRNAANIKSVIEAVDTRFSGKIGYAANWDNFDNPTVRDVVWEHSAIDFIGIDAYFPLAGEAQADASKPYPDLNFIETIQHRWDELLDNNILPFARARKNGAGMPVVFTEHGLTPFNRTTVEPSSENLSQAVDQDEQLNGFRGLLNSIDGRGDELLAVHVWHWGMPGSEESRWYLHPEGVENSLGSEFDESLGRRAARLLADFAGTAGLHFAQFGNGETGSMRFSSNIVLVNPSSTNTVNGQVVFWSPQGDAIPAEALLTPDAQTSFFLQPLGSKTLATSGTGELTSGSVTVTSDRTLSGVIRFSFRGRGIAGVVSGRPAHAVIAPVRREGTLSTGVAIRNPGIDPVTVAVSLKNEDGQEVAGGSSRMQVEGRGNRAQFVQELFPDAETAAFRGTICVTAENGQVVVIAVELGNQPGEFTTLPVHVIE